MASVEDFFSSFDGKKTKLSQDAKKGKLVIAEKANNDVENKKLKSKKVNQKVNKKTEEEVVVNKKRKIDGPKKGSGNIKKQKKTCPSSSDDDDAEVLVFDDSDDAEDGVQVASTDDNVDDNVITKETSQRKKKSKMKKILQSGEEDEFAKFLEDEDPELLDFKDDDLNESDDDASDDSDKESSTKRQSEFVGDENDVDAQVDDEDEEEVEDDLKNKAVVKGLKKWAKMFENSTATLATCKSLMRSFVQISTPMTASYDSSSKGSKRLQNALTSTEADDVILKSIVDLACVHLKPTLNKLLGTKVADKRQMDYTSLPKWSTVANPLQKYLIACVRIIGANLQQQLVYTVLKHLILMRSFLRCLPKAVNMAINVASDAWTNSSNHEIELSSFLLLERISKLEMDKYHQDIVRKSFSSYLKKASTSSVDSLHKIAFMQQCLIQLLALDLNFTYKLAFDSLKSIVLLVKAVSIDKKKEVQPELCSWKTVHTLYLWTSLFGSLKNAATIMSSLVYPIVETIKEIINFASGPRYYPLRFHCVDMLILLSKSSGKFIPVFQHLLDIFSQTDFNTKAKKMSIRPFNIAGTLRFSESDLTEKGFIDCVTERMYRLLLEIMNMYAYSIASPELFLIPIVHIRKFLKVCTNPESAQKFRQLVEKMEENAQFIASQRERVSFSIQDVEQIKKWESQIQSENKAPISAFYKKFIEVELKNKKIKDQLNQRNAKGAKMTRREIRRSKQKMLHSSKDTGKKVQIEKETDEQNSEKTKKKKSKKSKSAVIAAKGNNDREKQTAETVDEFFSD